MKTTTTIRDPCCKVKFVVLKHFPETQGVCLNHVRVNISSKVD